MTPHRTARRPVLVSAGWSASATVLAAAVTLWALRAASGVTSLGQDSYRTEFIDPALSQLVWVAVVLLAVAAWFATAPALVGLLGVTAASAAGMVVTVERYQESGWGDGLEYLGFVLPLGVLVVGALVVVGTAWAARAAARRRSHAPSPA